METDSEMNVNVCPECGADFGAGCSFGGSSIPFTCGSCGTQLIGTAEGLVRYEEDLTQ
jgi:ribosomal protein S27E